jgi:propionate CoA-transferase
VAEPEHHLQTYATPYSEAYAHEVRLALDDLPQMPLTERKVVSRRAAFELPVDGVVNLGIGMPEGVAWVAAEERMLDPPTCSATGTRRCGSLSSAARA